MSNNQRQRRFRERNPAYFSQLRARRKAEAQAVLAEREAAAVAIAVRREPLALPAPAETIEIPGMNTIPALTEQSPLPVWEYATIRE